MPTPFSIHEMEYVSNLESTLTESLTEEERKIVCRIGEYYLIISPWMSYV